MTLMSNIAATHTYASNSWRKGYVLVDHGVPAEGDFLPENRGLTWDLSMGATT